MKKNAAALLLLACISNALAVDGVSVEAGSGTSDTNIARLGLQWTGARDWCYWDASFGGWRNGHGMVYDFGLTPVFRLGKSAAYVEAAIGFHLLSDLDVGTGTDFSTHFQFGDHLGVGTRFGKYDWSVRLQHLSNGGLRNPNPGINFLLLRLQYRLN